MRSVFLIGILGFMGTAALGACSSTSNGTTGGNTTSSHASTSGSTGSTTGSGGATASGSSSTTATSSGTGGSTTTTGTTLNNCTEATATDMTTMTAVTIDFGGAALTYVPPCIKVKAGTMVTFSGSFTTHPLVAGTAPSGVDAASPIKPTATGSTATFDMTPAGSYGYYCSVHVSEGMEGAIFVQ
jgi:plastocyanin